MDPSQSTRRDFIQKTSAGVGAAVLAGTVGFPSITRADHHGKKVRFALAGLGNLSTNQIAPALQKTQHAELAGIITGTPAKAEKWKAQYGIPEKNIYNYDTMVELKDNPDIDVVYVVTPNGLHKEHTIKAANRLTKSDYSMYEDRTVLGAPELVMQRGEILLENGELKATKGRARFLEASSE